MAFTKNTKGKGKEYVTKNGEKRKALTMEQRAERYCTELKSGVNVYTGKQLTASQKGWRAGYMAKSTADAKVFKLQNPGYERKTKNKKY